MDATALGDDNPGPCPLRLTTVSPNATTTLNTMDRRRHRKKPRKRNENVDAAAEDGSHPPRQPRTRRRLYSQNQVVRHRPLRPARSRLWRADFSVISMIAWCLVPVMDATTRGFGPRQSRFKPLASRLHVASVKHVRASTTPRSFAPSTVANEHGRGLEMPSSNIAHGSNETSNNQARVRVVANVDELIRPLVGNVISVKRSWPASPSKSPSAKSTVATTRL